MVGLDMLLINQTDVGPAQFLIGFQKTGRYSPKGGLFGRCRDVLRKFGGADWMHIYTG